ncbi:MAG: Cell cycle serine/threonine-protein kinase cdc5/MSD2 [Phylliscum demangeonii]|nr:MAG: Cell cycle serine/threonine-protein kinase cdc5/MSD2 [Phylliscum demangeonii]
MHHPNIVEFHRAFTFKESTYIVLELCENGSLMDMVRRRRFLSEPEVRRYTIQTCGAIKYMHSKNVLHRDLKMGNIFLDDQMNVKIGDFGLAALLLSNSEFSLNRRRTLCGTPNYIAPEVLAKTWKGHDHKVDIWSLGIIMHVFRNHFAMLTGFPPFQSKTQEEIYRKVKARNYDWPSAETCRNQISNEAKDLVASMLVDAPDRPEPDDIVSHTFFRSGLIPESISFNATRTHPTFSDQPPQAGMNKRAWWHSQWTGLCRQCGVGRINAMHCFPIVGKEIDVSVYKECLIEEKIGCTPVVPIPADVVYRPLSRAEVHEKLQEAIKKGAAEAANMPGGFPPSPLIELPKDEKKVAPRKLVPAENGTASASVATSHDLVKRKEYKSHAARLREKDLPMKSIASASSAACRQPTSAGTGQLAAGRLGALAPLEEVPETEEERSKSSVKESQQTERSDEDARSAGSLGFALAQSASYSFTLVDPDERAEFISGSKAQDVQVRLTMLLDRLRTALNRRQPTKRPSAKRSTTMPVVVKWVDYTNKYGIGYTLSDGSMGCLLKAEGDGPPSGVLVRGSASYRSKLAAQEKAEKCEGEALGGKTIEFYENHYTEGHKCVRVEQKDYQQYIEVDGLKHCLVSEFNGYQKRKRRAVSLWTKFAEFMRDTLAVAPVNDRPGVEPLDEGGQTKRQDNELCVLFYQRLGNAGVWAFGDGSFQFNFPDHTKLVLSTGGTHFDFYHLPEAAARDLGRTGVVSRPDLDRRSIYSSAMREVVCKHLPSVVRANQLEEKMRFVSDVIRQWLTCGGLGCSDPTAPRLMWKGLTERRRDDKQHQLVWVTVGALGGDRRLV